MLWHDFNKENFVKNKIHLKQREIEVGVNTLTNRTEINIRFSEVDSLGIVWHGNILHYFEDGREAFGNEFDLGYLDIYNNGYVTPIVKVEIDYKRPLYYGEPVIVETTYIYCASAKLIYDYKIFSSKDNQLLTTGKTIQAFLNRKRELVLVMLPFFYEWKKKFGLIQ